MTDYLAKQKVARIRSGYNHTPFAPIESALPGMKGVDLQSWRDLLKPRPDEPIAAGYGPTQTMDAIRAMQYAPRVYSIQRLK